MWHAIGFALHEQLSLFLSYLHSDPRDLDITVPIY